MRDRPFIWTGTLPPLLGYPAPTVGPAGIGKPLGNTLIPTGEKQRDTDLRGEPISQPEAVHE